MNYSLRIENDIGSVEFSIISGIIIEEAGSFGGQQTDFQTTQSNREIGEKLEHQSVGAKTLTFRGTISGECEASKRQLMHVLAPLAKGRLVYNDEYELEVYVKTSPDVERYSHNARFSFSLYAPYPYWRKARRESSTLVGLKPLFSFPWNLSDPSTFRFSEYVEEGYVTVVNAGEAPVCWTATFLALDAVKNPRVYNMLTGEYVKILKTLSAGETAIVSTEGEELTVTLVASDGEETDGFQYLDIDSMPFKLAAGENYVKTNAEEGTAALRASISFQPAYVGV